MASQGNSICFLLPEEKEYINLMQKQYGITLHSRDRFQLMKLFGQKVPEYLKRTDLKYKPLKNIDNPDEKQEQLHSLRTLVRSTMNIESNGLMNLAKIAQSSSTRAYAGHLAEMRKAFDIKRLNLTEHARAFGLYKNMNDFKRNFREREDQEEKNKTEDSNVMFTKRLKKAKLKDLDKKLLTASGADYTRYSRELDQVKGEIYTNEYRLEARKKGFENAKTINKRQALSEFI